MDKDLLAFLHCIVCIALKQNWCGNSRLLSDLMATIKTTCHSGQNLEIRFLPKVTGDVEGSS